MMTSQSQVNHSSCVNNTRERHFTDKIPPLKAQTLGIDIALAAGSKRTEAAQRRCNKVWSQQCVLQLSSGACCSSGFRCP